MASQARAPRELSALPTRREVVAGTALGIAAAAAPGLALAVDAKNELTWAIHVSLAPSWFDPADTLGLISPFMVLYALHDAMVKPMPENPHAPSLAKSWSTSEDSLTHDFVLRDGVHFHNGEPVTAEDVKFSFERYRGAAHELMKNKVAAIEAVDSRHVRFKMKEPWPDFLTFYSSASGAGWIVPKKYTEKVGDDGFKQAPIGAGPYKFVSFTPGVELVLEAFDGYWRKKPQVNRIVMKVIPDESTRLAALKRGEVDIAYSIRGELAQELRNTPGLMLQPVVLADANWIYFPEQWDPKSPWHDLRVRQAANLALDREGMSKALFLGYCKITNNALVPYTFEYFWQPPPAVYDPAKARQLLAAAGYANGFNWGRCILTRPTPTSARSASTISRQWASAPRWSRSSAPGFSPPTPARSIATGQSAARAARSATRRPGWLRSPSRVAPSVMAVTLTSTRSIRSRPTNSTRKSVARSSPRCSSSSTRRRCMRRSGSSAS